MAELTLDLAIPRFKTNEERIDIFVNGSNTTNMTTSGGASVPSLAKLAKKLEDDAANLIAAKDTEINVNASGVLASSVAARDAAVLARNITTAARDTTVAAKDDTLTARDDALAAKASVEEQLAELTGDLSGLIHVADEVTTLGDDFELGFWNSITGMLGKIKAVNLFQEFRDRLTNLEFGWRTGDMKMSLDDQPQAKWVPAAGGYIGNAESNANVRANSDTHELFVFLHTNRVKFGLTIRTSAGSASTFSGTAEADWTANKQLSLPDVTKRFPRFAGAGLTVGTKEANQNKSHAHAAITDWAGKHGHPTYVSSRNDSQVSSSTGGGMVLTNIGSNTYAANAGAPSGTPGSQIGANGDHQHPVVVTADGGTEARPDSFVVYAFLKL